MSSASGPIDGAFVQVCRQGFPGCTATTVTGPDGNYATTNLPPGTYDVSVSAPGNLTPQTRTVPLADGEQRTEDFLLTGPQAPPAGTTIDDDTPPGRFLRWWWASR